MPAIPPPTTPGAYPTSTSLHLLRSAPTPSPAVAMGVLAVNDPNSISPAAGDPAVQSALVIGILISGILLFGMLVYFATRDQKLYGEPVTFVQYWIYYNMWILRGETDQPLVQDQPNELHDMHAVANTMPRRSGSSVTSEDSAATGRTTSRQPDHAEGATQTSASAP